MVPFGRGRSMRILFSVLVVGVLAAVAVTAALWRPWQSRSGATGGSGSALVAPHDSSDPVAGQPAAQCRVTALAVLDEISRGDGKDYAALQRSKDSAALSIARVVAAERDRYAEAVRTQGRQGAKAAVEVDVRDRCARVF